MKSVVAPMALGAMLLAPIQLSAAPVKLNFSYFSSDTTALFRAAVKPFVDAVNGSGVLEIKMHFSGAFGNLEQQVDLVRNGTVDIAFVVPGYTPNQFPDNAIIELPGLYRDSAGATATYTGLVAKRDMRGYEEFHVVGTMVAPTQNIHTRTPITSLAGLNGKRIRANNDTTMAALDKLGMIGVQMPLNQAAVAVAGGDIDGVAVSPQTLFDFGISRFVTNHYLLGVGAAPVAVLMNAKKFAELPGDARDIIRKYSGEWLGQRFVTIYEPESLQQIERLKENPRRNVVTPSTADHAIAANIFRELISEWAAKSPQHKLLHTAALREIAKQPSRGSPNGDPQ